MAKLLVKWLGVYFLVEVVWLRNMVQPVLTELPAVVAPVVKALPLLTKVPAIRKLARKAELV